jgi:glycosyltransferase involved in cell wall biosynthesis
MGEIASSKAIKMAKRKTFVTLYPYCDNSFLIKDPGQIPYFMSKMHGYDASVVTYKISENYFHKDGEVKGLNLEFINYSGRVWFIEIGVIKYLFKQAKKIDVFNLYHLSKYTLVYGILYKILNSKGFLYIKLDAYNEVLKKDSKYSKNTFKNFFLKILERKIIKKANLFSVENREGEKIFKQKFVEAANKTIYLPNGVNDHFLEENFKKKRAYSEKDNIILTTGRIGIKVKNHEMILRSIAKIDMKNWKLYFVGPIDPSFMNYFEELANAFPNLKKVVFFTGEVSDRKQLYNWYDRAKIFCMTSPFESFGISIIEAMYFGNYVIGTEGISTINDLTNNGLHGAIVKLNDDDQLAKILEKLINNEMLISSKQDLIERHIQENFLWSRLTTILHKRISASLNF